MRIEIINIVPPVSVPTQTGSYDKLEIAYKNADGKVQTKKLVSYAYPEVFNLLSKAERGSFYDVNSVKEGKFWNWTTASPADGSAPAPKAAVAPSGGSGGGRVVGSNYETPAEREWNRTRIGRQACLNSAVALAVSNGSKLKLEALLADAAKLEEWVNRRDVKREAVKAIENIADDIPF